MSSLLSPPALARPTTRTAPAWQRLITLERVVAAVALALIGGFLLAAYFRLTYQYPLVVMETPSIQAVRRLLQGQPLYGPPTLEYVPALYGPLYFYIAAGFALLLGPSLFALRLVSLLATVASTILIWHLVQHETRNRLAALLASAVFVCSTTLSETILDLARVDALSLCCILASLVCARHAEQSNRRSGALWLASGLLMGLAILSKQTATAPAAALLVVAVFSRNPRLVLAFVAGVVAPIAVAALVLTAQYGQWPAFYLVELPRQHTLMLQRVQEFWSVEVLPAFTLPLILLPFFLIGRWVEREYAAFRFWLFAALGMIGMAWGASLNYWSGSNVVSPAFAVLAIAFGLGFADAQRMLRVRWHGARAFQVYVLVLALAQLAFEHYNPRATSPLRSDVQAGQLFVSTIASLPGTVYAPEYPELAYQAGKGDDAFGLSIGELQGVFGGKPRPQGTIWTTAYAQALDERRFDRILLDPNGVLPFMTDSTRDHGYVDTGPLFPPGDEFYRLDSPYMPSLHVWVPRERVASR